MNPVLAAALAALDAGLCPIRPRTDGTKAPMAVPHHGPANAAGKRGPGWDLYQSERPSRFTVEGWFAHHPGLGIVCGAVSGDLQMLELEGRMMADEDRCRRFIEALDRRGAREVWARVAAGYRESTPGGGVHVLMHVPGHVGGNVRLATAMTPDGPRPLIETRGEGGFVIVAPSNGTTHPTGGSWTLEAGGFDTIAAITAEEWQSLLGAAMNCNEVASGEATAPAPNRLTTPAPWTGGVVGDSWMDVAVAHLEATDGVLGILYRHGWSWWRESSEMVYVTRPGDDKTGGVSAQVKKANGRLLNYSSSVVEFEAWPTFRGDPPVQVPTTSYDAADVLAIYEFGGDREAALRAVATATGIHAAWLAEHDPLGGIRINEGEETTDGEAEVEVRFRRWSVAELLAQDRTFTWDVTGMLVQHTYGLDAGELKTLKSYFGLARAIGLAAGVPILGQWSVPVRRRVLIFTAEGGRIPFTNRLERMALAHGIAPSSLDGWLAVIDDVAPLGSEMLHKALTHHLRDFAPDLVHLDPLYPFQPADVSPSQYTEVGRMLSTVQRLCAEHGATFWVTAHMNQSGNGFDLKRVSGAGHGEWGDSWALLRHRSDPDVEGGRFRLGLALGSRQWGGTNWDLDLNIGRFDADLGLHDGPITWNVRPAVVGTAGSDEEDPVLDVKLEVLRVGRRAKKPLTRSGWLARVKRRAELKRVAFDELVDAEQIVQIEGGRVPTFEVKAGC
jgi:hypothetical protein